MVTNFVVTLPSKSPCTSCPVISSASHVFSLVTQYLKSNEKTSPEMICGMNSTVLKNPAMGYFLYM